MRHTLQNLDDGRPDKMLEIDVIGQNNVEVAVHGARGRYMAYLRTNAAELRDFCRSILADEIMDEK